MDSYERVQKNQTLTFLPKLKDIRVYEDIKKVKPHLQYRYEKVKEILGADFKKLEPDRSGLGGAQFGSFQMLAQEPEQTISRGMEQEAELVCVETMAAEAVSLEIELQFLDPVVRIDTTVVAATLEGLVARIALPRLTEKNIKKIAQTRKKTEEEVKEFSINDYTKIYDDFHETFTLPCNIGVLIDLIGKLGRRCVRPRVTSYYFVKISWMQSKVISE